MGRFIKAIEGPLCNELLMDNGITLDLTTDADVVCLNNFYNSEFHCESCGIDVFVGDLSDYIEYAECED